MRRFLTSDAFDMCAMLISLSVFVYVMTRAIEVSTSISHSIVMWP